MHGVAMQDQDHEHDWQKLERRKMYMMAERAPDTRAENQIISLIAYSPEKFVERDIDDVDELDEYTGKWPVVWINVDGLGDLGNIRKIAEKYHLHPLAVEDVIKATQRAKIEDYDDK